MLRMQDTQALYSALQAVLRVPSLYPCQHEEIYRGGSIWTICSQCGMKWADDEGGMPSEFPMHPAITNAERVLGDILRRAKESNNA